MTGDSEPANTSIASTARLRRWLVPVAVTTLISIHCGLLAFTATRLSPTNNEPGHLVAGISNWQFGRFELYRVNPPLTRMLAAIPVLIAGCETDWSNFYDGPGARPVFAIGSDFIAANGERSIWLFTLARWACIPICVVGAVTTFSFARELWGSDASGLLALTLWCFSPNILGYAGLVTPDGAATSFGLLATYLFWRWLKKPDWKRATLAGLALGLAEVSKSSWIILFGLWPLLTVFWLLTDSSLRTSRATWLRMSGQLTAVLAIGLYMLNAAYLFDGTGTRLGEFEFVSATLAGEEFAGEGRNRFHGTPFADIPMPLPRQYICGIDVQKRDLESYGQPSYLCGRWSESGWWYYYIYALLVKVPHGTQAALSLSCMSFWAISSRDTLRSLIVAFAPAIALLVILSFQTGLNAHFRYLMPGLPIVFVAIGRLSQDLTSGSPPILTFTKAALVAASTVSALASAPQYISYFNEASGGPRNGWRHLAGSNFDWGQGYLILVEACEERFGQTPIYANRSRFYPLEVFGITPLTGDTGEPSLEQEVPYLIEISRSEDRWKGSDDKAVATVLSQVNSDPNSRRQFEMCYQFNIYAVIRPGADSH